MTLLKRQVPLHLQFSETECGIASLAMVLAYYKTHVSLEELRQKCGSSRDGCKASTLMKVAEEYGYHAEAYSVDIDDLKHLSQPIIAFWNFSHYVVIKRASSSCFYINDPAQGSFKISLNEFDKAFTGVIIVINPTKNSTQKKKSSQVRSLLKEWINKFYLELFFIMICMLVLSFVPLLNSSLSTLFINYCILYSNQAWIPWFGLVSFNLSLILSVATIYQKSVEFKLCAKASIRKSSEIIYHVFQLPLLFYSLRQKGEIIALLARAEVVTNSLFKGLCSLAIGFVSCIVCLVFMIKIDKSLFFTSLLLSILAMITSFILAKFTLEQDKSCVNASAKWYVYTNSSIRNIETIMLCGLENSVISKWGALYRNKLSHQDKLNTRRCLGDAINQAFASASLLCILFIGSYQISQGNLSIGHLMGYYALHLFLIKNLSFIIKTFKDIQDAYVSHMRINDVFQHKVDARFQNEKISPVQHRESPSLRAEDVAIHCHNISFHYNKNEPLTLSNINIKIKSGLHIALVGKSGSGKSTLAKLLCSLYQPTTGNIYLNNTSLSNLNQDEITKHFSYVSQDVSLFAGTIYENLTLWRESIHPDIVNRAINDACLTDLISSRGLHGEVAENGDNFSCGEKQRIDLARALIEERPILILDEATSALDTQTESKIINNLRKTNKTIVFVAHRLSTIFHCDEIYMMNNGIIIEQGNHHALLDKKGEYYQLINNEKQIQLS